MAALGTNYPAGLRCTKATKAHQHSMLRVRAEIKRFQAILIGITAYVRTSPRGPPMHASMCTARCLSMAAHLLYDCLR